MQLSDNKDADVTLALRSFREGDRVKAVVLSVDLTKRRISFGLKPSYFAEEDFQDDDESESDDVEMTGEGLGVVDASEDEQNAAEDSDGQSSEHNSHSEDEEDAEDATDVAMDVDFTLESNSAKPPTSAPTTASTGPLRIQNGFQWSATSEPADAQMDNASDSDSDVEAEGKKKKKRKRKEIEEDLTADMHTKAPESNADFERLLLGSPDSSYLWVQYMSFQLQISEVEKAREIAKRALKTINFREEQEKLNVWIALLNLENAYGTEESLEATFKDAARHNDSKTIHLRLAEIFDQSDKPEVGQHGSHSPPLC